MSEDSDIPHGDGEDYAVGFNRGYEAREAGKERIHTGTTPSWRWLNGWLDGWDFKENEEDDDGAGG